MIEIWEKNKKWENRTKNKQWLKYEKNKKWENRTKMRND